jgi:hypothetical protein
MGCIKREIINGIEGAGHGHFKRNGFKAEAETKQAEWHTGQAAIEKGPELGRTVPGIPAAAKAAP